MTFLASRIARGAPHAVRTGRLRQAVRLLSSLGVDDRPLAGIKVVDLTRVLAGPLATMMLVSFSYLTSLVELTSPQSDLGGANISCFLASQG